MSVAIEDPFGILEAHRSHLPQYAAQAVIDMRRIQEAIDTSSNIAAREKYSAYAANVSAAIDLLDCGIHIVLPENGELYRANRNIPCLSG